MRKCQVKHVLVKIPYLLDVTVKHLNSCDIVSLERNNLDSLL